MKTGGGQWILATILAIALLAILLQTALSVGDWSAAKTSPPTPAADLSPTSARLGMGLLGVRTDQLENLDPVARKGMSGYLLVFEIISVHLLVVLIGAAYLARAKRRVE